MRNFRQGRGENQQPVSLTPSLGPVHGSGLLTRLLLLGALLGRLLLVGVLLAVTGFGSLLIALLVTVLIALLATLLVALLATLLVALLTPS